MICLEEDTTFSVFFFCQAVLAQVKLTTKEKVWHTWHQWKVTALTGNMRKWLNLLPDVMPGYSIDWIYVCVCVSVSYSSGMWSPIGTVTAPNYNSANSFSAFGPNNSFNLTGGNFVWLTRWLQNRSMRSNWCDTETETCVLFLVFSGINLPKSTEPQQSWPEFSPVNSSIWDIPSSDPLHSWASSSSSPAAPTAVRSVVLCYCSLPILFLSTTLFWSFSCFFFVCFF